MRIVRGFRVILCIMATVGAGSTVVQGQMATWDDFSNARDESKLRLEKATKLIGPSDEDKQRHSAFLDQPKTGIIKLVPQRECSLSTEERKNRGRFAEKCPTHFLQGGGSNFSFRKKEYVFPEQADITAKGNLMYSMGTLAQGIMVKLGDVPIEDVTLQSEGMVFLGHFVPSADAGTADTQAQQFNRGWKDGNYLYARGFDLEEDQTFGLRVVAYKGDIAREVEMSGKELGKVKREMATNQDSTLKIPANASGDIRKKYDPLFRDERKDIIVVFRIVRVDPDGAATLIWKELQRKNSPKLVPMKGE